MRIQIWRELQLRSIPMGNTAIALGVAAACLQTDLASAQPGPAPLEEIQVTGTRIQRSGFTTPTPVTVVSADELQLIDPGPLVDALAASPLFLSNQLPSDGGTFGNTAGSSTLNLRGIGSNRMLVLLDGRRVVPSVRGTVNVSVLPEALVDRVEIVTGGASAAYGSDAVSGVTNFVLDTDFTGFDAHLQGGDIMSHGDRQNYEVSFSGGADLGERAHILGAVDHFYAEEVFGWDKRDWFRDYAELGNRGGGPDITAPNARSTLYTYGGLIPSGPLAGTEFLADGTPSTFVRGEIVSPPFAQSGGSGPNPLRDNAMYPEVERDNAFVYLDYDFTDNVTGYVQGMYGSSDSIYSVSELRLYTPFGTQATIFRDNAFLPSSIQTAMDTAAIDSFTFHRMSSFDDWTDLEKVYDETLATTIGVEADIGDGNWRLTAYYQNGENERVFEGYQPRMDRVYQAIDAVIDPATGRTVCRSTLVNPNDGCRPLNLFGRGQMTAEAREYIFGTHNGIHEVSQDFAEIAVDGELFSGRAAGPIGVAAGISYRDESLNARELPPESIVSMPTADEVDYMGLPNRQAGIEWIFQHSEILDSVGSYDVKELFAEAIVPLFANGGLTLDVAGRYADYSGSGSVPSWKVGLDWQVTDGFRLRMTRSRDIRAANLEERFNFQFVGATIDDPFIGVDDVQPPDRTLFGGNPDVGPEEADTWVLGAVVQPSGVEGLSFSIDFYDVDIKDAIDTVGAQTLVDLCFNVGSFCNQLVQDPVTGQVLLINDIYVNLTKAQVRGADLELSYTTPIDGLSFRLIGSYLSEVSFTDQFGNKVDTVGETGDSSLPENQALISANYSRGPFSVALMERYIGSGKRDNFEIEGIDVDDNSVDSVWYTDLRLAYQMESGGGTWNVFLNVQNLFDQAPPIAPGGFSFFSGTDQTNTNLFDPLGRRLTVGVRLQY